MPKRLGCKKCDLALTPACLYSVSGGGGNHTQPGFTKVTPPRHPKSNAGGTNKHH